MFFPAAQAMLGAGVAHFQGGENRVETMSEPCRFRVCFVLLSCANRAAVAVWGLTDKAARARGTGAGGCGREGKRSPPWSYPLASWWPARVTHARWHRSSILRSADELVR